MNVKALRPLALLYILIALLQCSCSKNDIDSFADDDSRTSTSTSATIVTAPSSSPDTVQPTLMPSPSSPQSLNPDGHPSQTITQEETGGHPAWYTAYSSIIIDLWKHDLDGFGFRIALNDINGDGIPEMFYEYLGENEGSNWCVIYYMRGDNVEEEHISGWLLQDKSEDEIYLYRCEYGKITYSCYLPSAYKVSLGENGIEYVQVFTYEPVEGFIDPIYIYYGDSAVKPIEESGPISLYIFPEYDGTYKYAWNQDLYPDLIFLLEESVICYHYADGQRSILPITQYDREASDFMHTLSQAVDDWTYFINDGSTAEDGVCMRSFELLDRYYLEHSIKNEDIISQPEQSSGAENPVEATATWYSAYSPYISAYMTFENGGYPDEIIYSPFIKSHWTATYFDTYSFNGIIEFALYDINSSGSPELVVGHRHGDEESGYFINIFDVYTVDGGSLNRIIACRPNDVYCTINTQSIMCAEGNIIGTITEYSLSQNGRLVEEYAISFYYEDIENILQEKGVSLNDTPAELDWKRLYMY